VNRKHASLAKENFDLLASSYLFMYVWIEHKIESKFGRTTMCHRDFGKKIHVGPSTKSLTTVILPNSSSIQACTMKTLTPNFMWWNSKLLFSIFVYKKECIDRNWI